MLGAGGIGADETDPARVAAVVALLSAGARVNDANKDGYVDLGKFFRKFTSFFYIPFTIFLFLCIFFVFILIIRGADDLDSVFNA